MDRVTGPEPTPSQPAEPPGRAQAFPAAARASAAGLTADPRLPIWSRRAVVCLIVTLVGTLWLGWRAGLTAGAFFAIGDTIYHSRTMALIPAAARASSAQRRSRRRLFLARPAGYLALHARAVPGTDSVIDHLVVGPGGVYALDSQRWDRRLPVRTVASSSAAGPLLYHGPFSQRDRLAHASWEAAQAARLLSAELGRPVEVRPAMVIYGPTIPWSVAHLRGVDVFSGRTMVWYFPRRKRAAGTSTLSGEQTGEIFYAARRALPPR